MSYLARTCAPSLSPDATLKWGGASLTIDEGVRESLLEEIHDIEHLELPNFIHEIELIPHDEETQRGGGVVFRGLYPGHEVHHPICRSSKFYHSAKSLMEAHLFEKGKALYEKKGEEWEGDWRSKLAAFSQKYCVPFSDGWAAARNAFGLATALIHLLVLVGAITVAPHVFGTLLIVYACFVLVQGILSVGPLCLGGGAGGVGQSKMAEELGDKKHQTSAKLKKWGGFFSLIEGSFWLAIALCDFTGLLSLSALLTKILFWGVFNFTFTYMAMVAIRDKRRHQKFNSKIHSVLNDPAHRDNFESYIAALTFIRDKWHMHLKPKHGKWTEEELIQKAGRKISRLEEQTSRECVEEMDDVDDLIRRLRKGDLEAIADAKAFIEKIERASKVKLLADWITIILGVVGIICWFDIFITWFGSDMAGSIVDWTLWVFLNLGFLLALDWDLAFQKVASFFTHSDASKMEAATLLPH